MPYKRSLSSALPPSHYTVMVGSEVHIFLQVQREKMASHLQSSTEEHLALACVKLNDTTEQLANTQAELKKTQTQLTYTQETTKDLVKKVDKLQRQLKEKLNEKQVNEAVESKVMQMKKAKSFMWKIHGFSELLRQAKQGFCKILKSDPFYTESCGYKMQLTLFPNGDRSRENTHVSVYLALIAGEYDTVLSWPFITAVKITLVDQQNAIDQQNDDFCFTLRADERPKDNSICALGTNELVSHAKLKTRCYLVDDTLFLRVVIGPDSTKLKWWSTDPINISSLDPY